MAVLAFNYTKVLGEKKSGASGRININNNVLITNIEEASFSFEKGKKGLKVDFEFTSNYDPEIGHILLEGNLLLLEDAKKVDEWLKQWSKEKKLPREVMTRIINQVLARCNIQSLILSRDLNLPSPIPLPKLAPQEQKKASSPKHSKKK